MAWTDDQDAYLASQRAKGSAVWAIARELDKSESSVRQRLIRLANRKALFEPQGPKDGE